MRLGRWPFLPLCREPPSRPPVPERALPRLATRNRSESSDGAARRAARGRCSPCAAALLTGPKEYEGTGKGKMVSHLERPVVILLPPAVRGVRVWRGVRVRVSGDSTPLGLRRRFEVRMGAGSAA